ncbi:hypothetical protein [Altericista sp. CCNU0014]|uniref:hypothetical protein n=1 Tax=Altericista sp. CCNU0014 TaxID=3082949 RepID=UPI00384D0C3F
MSSESPRIGGLGGRVQRSLNLTEQYWGGDRPARAQGMAWVVALGWLWWGDLTQEA